eukprot:7124757-Pyramimonas_sp.AAC.1
MVDATLCPPCWQLVVTTAAPYFCRSLMDLKTLSGLRFSMWPCSAPHVHQPSQTGYTIIQHFTFRTLQLYKIVSAWVYCTQLYIPHPTVHNRLGLGVHHLIFRTLLYTTVSAWVYTIIHSYTFRTLLYTTVSAWVYHFTFHTLLYTVSDLTPSPPSQQNKHSRVLRQSAELPGIYYEYRGLILLVLLSVPSRMPRGIGGVVG